MDDAKKIRTREEIPEEELAGMKTVGDTVRYINSKMK